MFTNKRSTLSIIEEIKLLSSKNNQIELTSESISNLIQEIIGDKDNIFKYLKGSTSYIPETITEVGESKPYDYNQFFNDILIYLKSEKKISDKVLNKFRKGLQKKGIHTDRY